MKISKHIRRPHMIGILSGILSGFFFSLYLWSSPASLLRIGGPLNRGHEDLQCTGCHQPARGTIRQQLQAKVRFMLGNRPTDVEIGYQTVDNQTCLSCHQNANDRHPVSRFLEPRFSDIRNELAPHECNSCHREHLGVRVSVDQQFCSGCHQDVEFANDPIFPTHMQLVDRSQWATCMHCHDFHGNHRSKAPTQYEDRHRQSLILDYLKGGESPYGPRIIQAQIPDQEHD